MSAAEAQHVASLTVKTLQDMRSDQSWSSFYALVTALQGKLDVDEPVLPRRRKVPRRFEDGQAAGTHPERAEDLYRVAYFEALDLAVSSIQERFDQPGYAMYRNLEELLLQALRDDDHTAAMQQVTGLYHELDAGALTVQLKALASHFASISSEGTSLKDCIHYLRSLSADARKFYSEVVCVVQLLLVMPATNAVSERSFSTMRRIKTYLRSTMRQDRLNYTMVMSIYKELVDQLDLVAVSNEFVSKNEHRSRFFGKF
ncbi:uncharacterized protein LOC135813016 [Sycon ciliatum]|uniref:uncharacterized protein LOC135813016 n=1 Tax=Sycon ciliatum TaxID=27933 RepID=UPI0031F69FEE